MFRRKKANGENLTFMQHLEELRLLLIQCFVALFAGCIIVGCFFPYFASILKYPLNRAAGTNLDAIQGLVTTSPMGIFSVMIQVCFLGGFALSVPAILYFIARFVMPALHAKELKVIIPSCISVLFLFFLGASFSYFYVIPASLGVSIKLNQMFGFELIWSASRYYGLVVWMTLGIGFCFEFPLGILLFVYLGVIRTALLRRIRRHMILAVLIASALITPSGDPVSLAILAVPLYTLYELAIIVGRFIEKKSEEAEKASEDGETPWPFSE